MAERVWLSSPHMGGKELEYVAEAFASNWIAPLGPHVDAFEKQLASHLGVASVAALSSGTASLHLALQILGVKPGDRVICQSFTFGASAFPITYCGAEPVFVDSEPETWNMDPRLLEDCITELIKSGKKPAAIIVVHLYGMPAKMDEIVGIASRYEIPVIEDAAEALGSVYKGKACGSMGELSVLSFNGNKIITTSGGGALAGNDEGRIARARFLATQAREPAAFYLHKETGYNYRMSNVLAGIGRGQMEMLSDRVARRRANFDYYRARLEPLGGIEFLDEPAGCLSNRWLTTVIFAENRRGNDINEKIRLALEKNNIETRHLWKPLHRQPVFSGCKYWGNGTSDHLFANGLCLPSGSNLKEETLERVSDAIINVLNETA